jgi:hypothetical protein
MSKFFSIYDRRKEYGNISAEWYFNKGGYCNVGRSGITILHRFFTKGQAFLGLEKEFIFRIQFQIAKENKISWFTVELINPFEARWIYFWFKIWKGWNFRFVFNLGFRLSKASRDFMGKSVIEKMRSLRKQNNNGGGNKWLSQSQRLAVAKGQG